MPDRPFPFERGCALLDKLLDGGFRRSLAAELARATTLAGALARLRPCMERHAWEPPGGRVDLARLVRDYDRRTRDEGLHALHDWDGKADRISANSIPVDVLQYLAARRGGEPANAVVPAILLDYYFLYVLALLSLRAWDEGSADEHLDRLEGLLARLQGPDGSGQAFAADAETLILVATSHFEVEDRGYRLLLERVRTLGVRHRVRVALGHAASMGCHLRFGFEATYGRDTGRLRGDNAADYPWLCFSLATLMEEYTRVRDARAEGGVREPVVEALLNGLSPDARAFVGEPPAALAACAAERARFREAFLEYRPELLAAFGRYRPTERAYSPLSFFFNFSHNVLKGTVVDALLRGRPWPLTLNDMFASPGVGEPNGGSRQALATTLMAHARSAPDRIRGRLMPVIIYDPAAGMQAFGVTMRKLRD